MGVSTVVVVGVLGGWLDLGPVGALELGVLGASASEGPTFGEEFVGGADV